ncbi:type IA DNA topoisomerase [Mesomycoplasma molare]|uniref:DNA topoisomerase n=1 Tax=Mesomycoplasma molare TaxID=171288 RepID=A0ABY5TVY2_9BACT|nr:type IA DNA topoisomerase [Mesomycoplasma molare]UWD34499.1 DNA topoisomerase [Mesomycoplasma molare]
MNLFIIEGLGKLKTISSYLGKDFKVIATGGHLRDLTISKENNLGFNFNNFQANWSVIDSNKKKIIKEINQYGKQVDNIYIATDPDREGEAIAWHISEVLDSSLKNKVSRVCFNEITKEAILNSILNKTNINQNLVNAQFVRRIYDRYFGFKASNVVQKVLKQKSAGRVQSVALTILEKRQQEIEKFVETNSWTLEPELNNLKLKLIDKDFEIGMIFNKDQEAKEIYNLLSEKFILKSLETNDNSIKKPLKPFTTSELQKTAGKKFKLNAETIEKTLQNLYQGVTINGIQKALISYPRTDSTRISDEFNLKASEFVHNNFEKEFWNDSYWFNQIKQKDSAQDGHEALRPIDFNIKPNEIKEFLTEEEFNIYSLIYEKTLECYLAFSVYKKTTFKFENNSHIFKSETKSRIFKGFEILKNKTEEENKIDINDWEVNKEYFLSKNENWIVKHTTKPPENFTQATLIAYLERKGIGRPSTYATMAQINIKNGYVFEDKKTNKLFLNIAGRDTAKFEIEKFSNTISETFTKDMEEKLDGISKGHLNWKDSLIELKNIVDKELENISFPKGYEIEYLENAFCPKCNSKLINKEKLISCENYFYDVKTKKSIGKCDYIKWKNKY